MKWPTYLSGGRITDEYKAFTDDISICYDLVKIGSHIMGRDLLLIMGTPTQGITRAATDGKNVFIPKTHPNRKVATKHELSHIYFRSNLALRLAFARALVDRFEERRGRPISPHLRNQMITDICFLVNIFDDLRVNSLWGLIYPGDGREMDDHYFGSVGPSMMKSALKTWKNGNIDHFFTYTILRCLNQPAESEKWGIFERDIDNAAASVLWTSFPACLVACRELIENVLIRMVEDMEERDQKKPVPPGQTQLDQAKKDIGDKDENDDEGDSPNASIQAKIDAKALEKMRDQALQQLFGGRTPDKKFKSDNAGFDVDNQVPDPHDQKIIDLQVQKLLDMDLDDVDDLDKFLSGAVAAGTQMASKVKRKMSSAIGNAVIDDGEYLRKALKADLKVVRVRKNRLRAAELSPMDLEAAERWRKQILRVMGVLRNRLEMYGGRLSTADQIRARVTGLPHPCYVVEATGRGFELVISVDMSSSMAGATFKEVERLVVILRKALDFPFVKLKVQGWSSKVEGGVILYDYPTCRGNEGLVSPESKAGGVTPLSHAVQLAGRTMMRSRNERHIFLISDGYPVYKLKGRKQYMKTEALREWTRDAVMELRQQRINVWCWMIGNSVPADESMDFMFGPRNWRKINVDQIYKDGFDFLSQQFLTYLRTR